MSTMTTRTSTVTATTLPSLMAVDTDTNTDTTNDTATVSWQEAGYRCPRPGFFLGDDGTLASHRILATASSGLAPSWDLGVLHCLPLELLQMVVEALDTDTATLVRFRNINRATAAVVDSCRDVATVAAFPRALGALARLTPTGPDPNSDRDANAHGPSLRALAACLRSTKCASCHASFGDCVYLLTPERVCYACFRSKPEYLPVAHFTGPSSAGSDAAPPPPATPSLRVPPGRYGVLARLTQHVDLFDRRAVEASQADADTDADADKNKNDNDNVAPANKTIGQPRPEPLRYAAVIPGPYFVAPNGDVDRGYACRACCQTDRAHAGWADPLARYTAEGLEHHVTDPRFGGRVVRTTDPRTGHAVYAHDSPRTGFFPPPAEFGATADLARRYEAVVSLPVAQSTAAQSTARGVDLRP